MSAPKTDIPTQLPAPNPSSEHNVLQVSVVVFEVVYSSQATLTHPSTGTASRTFASHQCSTKGHSEHEYNKSVLSIIEVPQCWETASRLLAIETDTTGPVHARTADL